MSDTTTQLSVADWSRIAKHDFSQVLSKAERSISEKQLTIQPSDIQDLLDKFTLWAGSLGALQAPSKRISLDHRLREAPDIGDQLCQYLSNLQEAIQDRG